MIQYAFFRFILHALGKLLYNSEMKKAPVTDAIEPLLHNDFVLFYRSLLSTLLLGKHIVRGQYHLWAASTACAIYVVVYATTPQVLTFFFCTRNLNLGCNRNMLTEFASVLWENYQYADFSPIWPNVIPGVKVTNPTNAKLLLGEEECKTLRSPCKVNPTCAVTTETRRQRESERVRRGEKGEEMYRG